MKRVLIAVAGLVLVAGCAQAPQVAARVGGAEISAKDVDILGKALCIERVSSGQAPATSLSAVRGSALAALIESVVDARIAKTRHLSYNSAQLTSSMQQLDSLIKQLPASERDRGTVLIRNLLRGQLQVSTAALLEIQRSGQQPTQQLVTQAVQQLEAAHVSSLKISVNPEFTSPGYGSTKDGHESISRAVSSSAQEARKAFTGTPSAAYVADLPSTQKCG